jgi:hypothetical protein
MDVAGATHTQLFQVLQQDSVERHETAGAYIILCTTVRIEWATCIGLYPVVQYEHLATADSTARPVCYARSLRRLPCLLLLVAQPPNILTLARTSFRGEVKPSVPCRRFTACKRTLHSVSEMFRRQNFPTCSHT